jgi:hypothetical protein
VAFLPGFGVLGRVGFRFGDVDGLFHEQKENTSSAGCQKLCSVEGVFR